MNKLFTILFLSMFLISFTSALDNLGTFEVDKEFNLMQICFDSCTYVNLTSVQYPNGTLKNYNNAMDQNGYNFNYSFSTNLTGNYYYTVCGDKDGVRCERIAFSVTYNGKEPATPSLVIFFSLILLIVLGGSLWALVYSFGHLINLDFDLKDWAYNWGAYFVLLGAYQLAQVFLGSVVIETWLLNFIVWYRYPVIMIPPVAFLISLVMQKKAQKKEANKW